MVLRIFLGEMPQERFFKKTYMGPYPAVSASGFQLHSAKIKRESAVCLHYAFYLPFFYLLDHDEERFKRAVEMDLNGVSFNVVFDPSDRRFYWLMVPIQLSPITGLKQNLNCSDPFPREKEFCDQNADSKHDGSGMDDIMRFVACFFSTLLFFYNFFYCFSQIPMAQTVYPLNSKTPKKSSPKSSLVKIPDASMSKLIISVLVKFFF